MKKIILATLAAATVMTPVISQAATIPVETSRTSAKFEDNTSFQRGDGSRGEARRGEGRRGGGDNTRRSGGRSGDDNRGRGAVSVPQQAQQAPQNVTTQRTWSRDRNRVDDSRNDRQRSGYDGRNRSDDSNRNWERGRERSVERSRVDSNRSWDRGRERSIERNRDDNRNNRSGYSWGRDNDNRGNSWNQGWRNDRRYDWRGHRDRYRNYYSPGRYSSPYRGHSYRRYGIGINIGSAFFGSRYWISDPSYYRLPPAYGSYRWVRYYDDVLLIDLRTGRVVDAIHDFFW